jgi:hypothetical protein
MAQARLGGYFLQPSYIIPSHDRRIQQRAKKIVVNADKTQQQIFLIVDWIQENITQKPYVKKGWEYLAASLYRVEIK